MQEYPVSITDFSRFMTSEESYLLGYWNVTMSHRLLSYLPEKENIDQKVKYI